MSLIYYILSCFGLTQILVSAKILECIRPKHYFFHCSMCTGFHVGWIVWYFSKYTTLFTYDRSFVTAFLLACLSSGTSYVLCSIFGDEGIKYERNNRN